MKFLHLGDLHIGKRLFKMAPIHHHFEQCGWSERKIVAVFTVATVLFCAAAWFGL